MKGTSYLFFFPCGFFAFPALGAFAAAGFAFTAGLAGFNGLDDGLAEEALRTAVACLTGPMVLPAVLSGVFPATLGPFEDGCGPGPEPGLGEPAGFGAGITGFASVLGGTAGLTGAALLVAGLEPGVTAGFTATGAFGTGTGDGGGGGGAGGGGGVFSLTVTLGFGNFKVASLNILTRSNPSAAPRYVQTSDTFA
jgi:hypothetical protein